jgi:hypothetical protein
MGDPSSAAWYGQRLHGRLYLIGSGQEDRQPGIPGRCSYRSGTIITNFLASAHSGRIKSKQ